MEFGCFYRLSISHVVKSFPIYSTHMFHTHVHKHTHARLLFLLSLVCVSATCDSVVLTGEFAGNYTVNGTYRGRPDFFSADGLHNLYFEMVVRRQRDRALVAENDHLTKGAMSRSGEG